MKLKSALATYPEFWKDIKAEPILKMLDQISILDLPSQSPAIASASKERTIVVLQSECFEQSQRMLELGFCHCLSRSRRDFASEILAAALIIMKPQTLANQKIPFFFRRFLKRGQDEVKKFNFLYSSRSTKDKNLLVSSLDEFLDSNERLKNVKDLVLEINEELFRNAFFHGAVSQSVSAKLGGYNDRSEISLSGARVVDVFAAYDDEMLIIGCLDTFGKMTRSSVMNAIFPKKPPTPSNQQANRGMGLKMCLENSASIYFFSEPQTRTIVTCGLLLGSLRANLSENKHIHLSLE